MAEGLQVAAMADRAAEGVSALLAGLASSSPLPVPTSALPALLIGAESLVLAYMSGPGGSGGLYAAAAPGLAVSQSASKNLLDQGPAASKPPAPRKKKAKMNPRSLSASAAATRAAAASAASAASAWAPARGPAARRACS